MISNKAPMTAPWGTHKFMEPRTYAPKFHQPQKLRHIDQNSTLDLGWENVKPRDKPKTVVDEMKETLEKINGLLTDLGSRAKTNSHIARNAEMKKIDTELRPMRDSTINSCLESLCDDISVVTDQLKQLSPTLHHRQLTSQDRLSSNKMVSEAVDTLDTVDTPTTDLTHSRKSSVSTLNSHISLMAISLEEQTNESPPTSTETDSSDTVMATATTRKRSRSCSGTRNQSVTYHRGSEISNEVSMHRSNFSCIADLCGYGGCISRIENRTTSQVSKSTSSFSIRPNKEECKPRGVYFSEYPPQRGSVKFDGIFHDDITALLDDTARGLLVL